MAHVRPVTGGWEVGIDHGDTIMDKAIRERRPRGFDHNQSVTQHSQPISPVYPTEMEATAFLEAFEMGRKIGHEEGRTEAIAECECRAEATRKYGKENL